METCKALSGLFGFICMTLCLAAAISGSSLVAILCILMGLIAAGLAIYSSRGCP